MFLIRRDVERLLVATRLDSITFQKRYLREVNLSGIRRISLIEKPNYDCIFWESDGCSVYRHRPMQCRSYPFWSGNLISRHSWEQLKCSCPGIGAGRVHSRREIERWIRKAEANRFLSNFAEMQ